MRHKQNYKFSIDILAPEVKFFFGGRSSQGTKVGKVLSIACICMFLVLAYIIVSDYFDTSKPRVTQEPIPLSRLPRMNFVRDKRYPMVLFNFMDGTPIPKGDLKKYFSVYFTKQAFYPDKPPDMKYYGVVPCSELVARNKLDTIVVENSGVVKSTYLTFGYCVDIEDDDVNLGGADEGVSEVAMFQVGPCVLGNDCKPKADIGKVGFYVTNPVAYTNYGNYNKPVQYLTEKNEHEFINFGLTLRHKYVYQKTSIVEKKGFLSKEKVTHEFFSIGKLSTGFYSRDSDQTTCVRFFDLSDFTCMPYYSFEMIVSGTALKITREYKGVVESMSEMGGMIDIVYLFFAIIYGFYYHRAFKAILVKNVFGFDAPRSLAPNKKKVWCLRKTQSSVQPQTQEESEYLNASQAAFEMMDIVSLSKQLNVFRGLSKLFLPENSEGLMQQFFLSGLKQRSDSSLPFGALPSGEDPQKNKQKTIINAPALKIQLKKRVAKKNLKIDRQQPAVLVPKKPEAIAPPQPNKLDFGEPAEAILRQPPSPRSSVLERLREEIQALIRSQIGDTPFEPGLPPNPTLVQ